MQKRLITTALYIKKNAINEKHVQIMLRFSFTWSIVQFLNWNHYVSGPKYADVFMWTCLLRWVEYKRLTPATSTALTL
jgi:hypothetical protein